MIMCIQFLPRLRDMFEKQNGIKYFQSDMPILLCFIQTLTTGYAPIGLFSDRQHPSRPPMALYGGAQLRRPESDLYCRGNLLRVGIGLHFVTGSTRLGLPWHCMGEPSCAVRSPLATVWHQLKGPFWVSHWHYMRPPSTTL